MSSEKKVALEIDCQGTVPVSVTFTADGRHILSGECSSNLARGKLRRWHVKDGKETGTAVDVSNGAYGIAVSNDGQWRVSIEGRGAVVRTTANKRVATVGDHRDAASRVYVIDVSPDSTKFVSGSGDGTIRVFSIATGQRLLSPLRHDNKVYGVKFSPSGDRIASAALGDGLAHLTPGSVRIWDTSTGAKLIDVSINKIFTPCTPFAWTTESHLFVVASSQISQIHVPTAQVRSGWSLAANYSVSYCSLVTNGRFIVCADDARVTFWDATGLARVGPMIEFQSVVRSIALSPDGHYLACGRNDEKIVLYALRDVLPLRYILDVKPVLQLPLVKVDGDTFKSWTEDDLISTDAFLSKDPVSGPISRHHALANRALVRVRRQQWTAALDAAEESLAIQPSPAPHIAKALARIGLGEQDRALESFDLVFRDCRSDDIEFLLLIKGILLYVSGKHEEGISRVSSLLSSADDSKKYDYLQVLGNMYLKQGDFERAMTSFGQAQTHALSRQGFRLVTILLIFGTSFEELEITRVLGVTYRRYWKGMKEQVRYEVEEASEERPAGDWSLRVEVRTTRHAWGLLSQPRDG